MEWFAKGADVLQDPRTWAFAAELGVSVPAAAGHLDGIYGMLARHGDEHGQIGDVPDTMLEYVAMWTGERGKFAATLRDHYQDSNGTLHRWREWNGADIAHAKRQKGRKREAREAVRRARDAAAGQDAAQERPEPRPKNGTDTSQERPVHLTRPDTTRPDPTVTTTTNYLPPTRKKREPRPKGERVTWLTPIGAAWESVNGPGSFPYPQAARELEPLTKAGIAPDEIARRLAWYLENKGSESVLPPDQLARKHFTPSLRDFRLRHGKFDPSAPSEAA